VIRGIAPELKAKDVSSQHFAQLSYQEHLSNDVNVMRKKNSCSVSNIMNVITQKDEQVSRGEKKVSINYALS
jgi:hypothetical protein